MTIAQSVRTDIRKLPRGPPFTASHFATLGSGGAVDRALSRIVREGEIERPSRSVFVRPRKSRFVGAVLPGVAEVVRAIAKDNRETVQVYGSEAARRLGLSPQLSYRLRPISTLHPSPALFDHATLTVAGNPGPANRLMPPTRIMVHPAFALLRPDAGEDSTP